MTYQTARIISNLFILSGVTLFIGAIILTFLKHRSSRAESYYDLGRTAKTVERKQRHSQRRAPYSKEIKLRHPATGEDMGNARGRDLHTEGAGIGVPLKMEIKPDTKLEIELSLEGEVELIRIGAEVVWAEGLEDKDLEDLSLVSEFFARRIGLKFTDIEDQKKQKINIYIKGISKDNQQEI